MDDLFTFPHPLQSLSLDRVFFNYFFLIFLLEMSLQVLLHIRRGYKQEDVRHHACLYAKGIFLSYFMFCFLKICILLLYACAFSLLRQKAYLTLT